MSPLNYRPKFNSTHFKRGNHFRKEFRYVKKGVLGSSKTGMFLISNFRFGVLPVLGQDVSDFETHLWEHFRFWGLFEILKHLGGYFIFGTVVKPDCTSYILLVCLTIVSINNIT